MPGPLGGGPAAPAPAAPAFPTSGVIGALPALPNPAGSMIGNLLMGLGALPEVLQQRQQQTEKTEQTKLQTEEMQAKLEAEQNDASYTKLKQTTDALDFFTQLGQTNPAKYAADPAFASQLDKLYQGIGMQGAPRTAEGGIDFSALPGQSAFAKWLSQSQNYTSWVSSTPEQRRLLSTQLKFNAPDDAINMKTSPHFSPGQITSSALAVGKTIDSAARTGLDPQSIVASIMPNLQIMKDSGLYTQEQVDATVKSAANATSTWLKARIANADEATKIKLQTAATDLLKVNNLADYQHWQEQHGNELVGLEQQKVNIDQERVDSEVSKNKVLADKYRGEIDKTRLEVQNMKSGKGDPATLRTRLQVMAGMQKNIDGHIAGLRQAKAALAAAHDPKTGTLDTSAIDAQIEQYQGQQAQISKEFDEVNHALGGGTPNAAAATQKEADDRTVARVVAAYKNMTPEERAKDQAISSVWKGLSLQLQQQVNSQLGGH